MQEISTKAQQINYQCVCLIDIPKKKGVIIVNCPRCNFPINDDNVWSNCPKCNCILDRNNNSSNHAGVTQPKRYKTNVTGDTPPSTNHSETQHRPRHTTASPNPTISFCSNCGCRIKGEYIFCPNCGSSTRPTGSRAQNNSYVRSNNNKSSSLDNHGIFYAEKGINKLFISEILYLIYSAIHSILLLCLIAVLNKTTQSSEDESIMSLIIIVAVLELIVIILSYVFRFIGTIQLSKSFRITKIVYVLLIIEPLLTILSKLIPSNNSFIPYLLAIISLSANLGLSLIVILEITRKDQGFNYEQIFQKKAAIIFFICICLGYIILTTIMYSSLNNMITSENGFLLDSITSSIRKMAIYSLLSNIVIIFKSIYCIIFLNKAKRMFSIINY